MMENTKYRDYKQELQGIQEILHEIICILIVLETDLSVECSDGVYYSVVKVIHRMLSDAQHTVEGLVQCIKEGTE